MVGDFDRELDRALDALDEGTTGLTAGSDDGFNGLLEIARQLQSLPAEDWPDPLFADRLVGTVGQAMRSQRQARARRRRAWITSAVSVPVAAAIALVLALTPLSPLGAGPSVSAQTLARHAAAVSEGRGLAPVRFTVVMTSDSSAIFEPTPPPSKVTESVTFASASRWRVDATIVEANDAGVDHLTTIRSGSIIAAEDVSAAGVRSEWTVTTHAGSDPDLPGAGTYGLILDPDSTLSAGAGRAGSCARSVTVSGRGPAIDGRPTRLLELGPDPCSSAAIPGSDGPATFTIDAGTSLILRARIYSIAGSLLEQADVTQLTFGGTFANSLFALPSPAQAPTPTTITPQSPELSGLAQLEARLGHRPLMPAGLPTGLHQGQITPEATDPATGRLTSFTVTYIDADGHPALQLYEAPKATQSVRFPGRTVLIRAGQNATLATSPEMTILWWIQNGTYLSLQQGGQSGGVTLSGHLSQQHLIALAARIA